MFKRFILSLTSKHPLYFKMIQNYISQSWTRWLSHGYTIYLLATLLKKRLWHMSFPVNLAKLLIRTPFLQNTTGRLLLQICSGTFNSDHFRGPVLVTVALEVTVVGRFYYMYIFIKKNWPEEVGGAIK